MALATRKSGDIHSKSGGDLLEMKSKYDNSRHEEYAGFEEIGAILYQLQLLREDIDELRRYIISGELLLPDTMGDSLPTSDPVSAGQLWNSSGVLKISRG
jgi:hypothetical protein